MGLFGSVVCVKKAVFCPDAFSEYTVKQSGEWYCCFTEEFDPVGLERQCAELSAKGEPVVSVLIMDSDYAYVSLSRDGQTLDTFSIGLTEEAAMEYPYCKPEPDVWEPLVCGDVPLEVFLEKHNRHDYVFVEMVLQEARDVFGFPLFVDFP